MSDVKTLLADLPPLNEEAREDACFRAKDVAWAELAALFARYKDEEGLTYAQLGKRIGRSKQHVQRWLSSPFNLSIQSLGLLAEGMNAELSIHLCDRAKEAVGKNHCHPREDARAHVEADQSFRTYYRLSAVTSSASPHQISAVTTSSPPHVLIMKTSTETERAREFS